MNEKAVILFSGGMDSTTVLYYAKSKGYEIYTISFDYGQRNKVELSAAEKIKALVKPAGSKIIKFNMSDIGGSSLTSDLMVPKGKIATSVQNTYVPCRNTIFLSFAASYAETIGASNIFIGANADDYNCYPDCRDQFLRSMEATLNLGTNVRNFKINAPLVNLDKTGIVKLGVELSVPYELTHSCYDPDEYGHACGNCQACLLRTDGFSKAGYKDKISYQELKRANI